MSSGPAVRRLRAATLALLLMGGSSTLASAAPSPEELRACVERNLPRYSNPGTAVAAQYADVETACVAGIEDGSISVEFTPAPSGDPATGATADPQEDVAPAAGGPSDGGPGAAGAPTGREAGALGPAEGRGATPQGAETPRAGPAAANAVSASIAGGEGDTAGLPLPSSLAGSPLWLMALIGGAVGAVVGAAVFAARRRPT